VEFDEVILPSGISNESLVTKPTHTFPKRSLISTARVKG